MLPWSGYTDGMWYELWSVESGNLMHDFDMEAEALEASRAYLNPDDSGVVADVVLVVYGDDGKPIRSLHGADLAARAGAAAERRRLPA